MVYSSKPWKHPHACGEDAGRGAVHPKISETPPRVWGRRLRSYSCRRRSRNTPTRVGKTRSTARWRRAPRKHPHACGEDPRRMQAAQVCRETPPRVWGRLGVGPHAQADARNTPTRVGKTTTAPRSCRRPRKHPHACGEDGFLIASISFSLETPPRVWGRPSRLSILGLIRETPPRVWGRQRATTDARRADGNTPTRVGKTVSVHHDIAAVRKHPHACGED